MQRSKNDIWVGIFVLLGAAAVLFLALQAANLLSLNFQQTYRIEAKFDNVGGLKPKAAVRSAGVLVGRVEAITFDDKTFQARVTLPFAPTSKPFVRWLPVCTIRVGSFGSVERVFVRSRRKTAVVSARERLTSHFTPAS